MMRFESHLGHIKITQQMRIVQIKVEKTGDSYRGTAEVKGAYAVNSGNTPEEVQSLLIQDLKDNDEICDNNYIIKITPDK